MPGSKAESPFERAQRHAFGTLFFGDRQRTNLYISHTILQPGEKLGPPFQQIAIGRRSILVFVDGDPSIPFPHQCSYLLYDSDTGAFRAALDAQFPPFLSSKDVLTPFHQPVPALPWTNPFFIPPDLHCPFLIPDGERYAILFSGLAYPMNLNNLEFSYRTLIDRYGFQPDHIHVHLYDGTVNTWAGPPGLWPGDSTPFRIQVTGPGNRASLQQTLNLLGGILKPDDLLFLHTENEATLNPQSCLVTYPNWGTYCAGDLAADLSGLPKHRSLIALMASCYSVGFLAPLLAASRADNTCVSCSSGGNTGATPDWHFEKFGCDWISAQVGHDPFGAPLAFSPDFDADGVIEAEEAFAYAFAVHSSPDTPSFGETSETAGDISLSQRYDWWWLWCWLVLPILERYYQRLPPPEFYARLNSVMPALQKMLPAIDTSSKKVRQELQPKVEAILAPVLGGSGRSKAAGAV